MNEHKGIILEALKDYRQWFVNQGGDIDEIEDDKEKVEEIDKAIKYINNLKEE